MKFLFPLFVFSTGQEMLKHKFYFKMFRRRKKIYFEFKTTLNDFFPGKVLQIPTKNGALILCKNIRYIIQVFPYSASFIICWGEKKTFKSIHWFRFRV
jgi:hypothetical protein